MGNQKQYLEDYRTASEQQLNKTHFQVVDEFVDASKDQFDRYMLTIARDGEQPVRSIREFNNAIDAVNVYNSYTDWGFAKEYLTVRLYQPGGFISEKVLRRVHIGGSGGDCTFIKEDYIQAAKIMLKYKDVIEYDNYQQIVKDFAGLFSRDNIRFDVSRFFKETECEEVFE
jgi:hypothetical protein